MPAALARHDKILDRAVVANRGRVFSTAGDGRAAAFATAGDAIAAALSAQRDLVTQGWAATGPLLVRMGLHTGPAEERNGDYLGPTVNRAARLMAVAHGGQIVCSRVTAELIGDELPDGADLTDLGEHRLRDLTRPEHVLQLTHASLPIDFPPLTSLDASQTNLPVQASAFVGRGDQLEEVATALVDSRIVTLTGVGGVGKTRLALQVAAEALPSYRDGAWLVELGPTVDPDAVSEVAATALGVTQLQGRSITDSLLDFLTLKRVLIILDNCEHLLDAAARVAETIISACPSVALLATSREGLGVAGERILAVRSLELPPEDGELKRVAEAEAVRLFAQRAGEAKADFGISTENAPAVAALCRRLDGIPLAIELAAARVRSLTPAELATRLDDRFRLLAGGRRTAVERHQTLRRAIDWSYDLLPEIEQRALRRLSVFAGGFSIPAAEAVIRSDDIDVAAVFDILGHLVDKSLVLAEPEGESTRYRLLETIRDYAEGHLEAAGEAEALRRRHAEHYASFAEQAHRGLRSREEAAWTLRVEADLDNLRAALAWSVATGDVSLALRLVKPIALHGTRIGYAAISWARPVVAMPGASDHPLFPEALDSVAWSFAHQGDLEGAAALARQALAVAQSQDLGGLTMCRALNTVAGVALYRLLAPQAHQEAERWVELARSLDDDYELAIALSTVATVRRLVGDIKGGSEAAEEALARARRIGNPHALAVSALVAGGSFHDLDPRRALQHYEAAIEAGTPVGSDLVVGAALSMSSGLLLEQGDWRAASRTEVRAFEHFHRAGDRHQAELALALLAVDLAAGGVHEPAALMSRGFHVILPGSAAEWQKEAEDRLRSRLGEERFAELATRGEDMDHEELATFIRREVEPLLVEDEESRASVAPSGINEFRREEDVWLLTYDRRSCRLRDAKGLQYLAVLLAQPGQEIHVFDLVGSGISGGRSGEVLDARAKAGYRQRLAELEAEETEATEWGDSVRADRARLEAEAITAQLAAAYGLGGRPRSGADPTERARKAVANRIRDSLARIDDAYPSLGRHLRNSVHTGTFCSYQPERPTIWNRGRASS
jgi:predicted ATPase